ncbi:MAG TPA: VOC family protein [Syntrophales bacterium]|nr:VOC family protein [Syntrophales bacterium]HPQ44660.1 VOC family protein [Syntrophales bacterium]
MIKRIDHIGIAVERIDDTLAFLKDCFGAEELARNEYPEMQQTSSTVRIQGTNFELMEPTGPDGAIGQFMKNSPRGGYHHISILCDDLKALVDDLEQKGLKIIGKMYDGPDRVAFIHPKSAKGLLIELTDTGSVTQ